jgi:hypothetical protein
MPRRTRSQSQPMAQPPAGPTTWLRADYEFPSTFSYRMPDVSAQFAVGSPIPSPAAVKLALVDTAIRWSGDVNEGRRIFDIIKTASICVVPPPRIARFRAFIKRLKPDKVVACANHPSYRVSAKLRRNRRPACPFCGTIPDVNLPILEESTGVRDYFLLDGPLSVFIEVPQSDAAYVTWLLQRIRRFGTSDSICWCVAVCFESPDQALCPQRFGDQSHAQGGLVVRLSDLTQQSQFNGFDPFRGNVQQARLEKAVYVLPLRVRRSGETWAILERIRTNTGGLT